MNESGFYSKWNFVCRFIIMSELCQIICSNNIIIHFQFQFQIVNIKLYIRKHWNKCGGVKNFGSTSRKTNHEFNVENRSKNKNKNASVLNLIISTCLISVHVSNLDLETKSLFKIYFEIFKTDFVIFLLQLVQNIFYHA